MPRVVLLVAFVVIAVAGGAASAGVMLDKVVAVVNNEAVTWSELYRAMEFEMSRQMMSLSDAEKRAVFKEQEDEFLEEMINVTVQLQEARRLGIAASDEDVENAIESIKDKYSMDDEALIQALKAEGFTLPEYKKKLREQIIIGRLVEREVKSKILITEEELEEYGEKEPIGNYRIRQIFFRAEGGDGALEKKVSTVLEALASGEDFSSLARRYSQGPMAREGGDLGYVEKGQMAEDFASVVKDMKPGEVSEPFRTERGVHIIKLEDTREIREMLLEERFEARYRNWLKQLRENSFVEIRL